MVTLSRALLYTHSGLIAHLVLTGLLIAIAEKSVEDNESELERLRVVLPTEEEFYEPTCWERLRICYKAKSTIQFAGGFR